MAQQIQASFSLRYSSEAQRFAPSGSSPQFSAGVSAGGGFGFDVAGGASIFSRVLLPLNADFDTGSGIGNEGFKFQNFPEMQDSAGNPIADVNGLPLDFTTLTVLSIRVRAIDPDLPWGGTVNVTTAGVVPGDTFGQTGIDSPALLICQRLNGWTPGGSASILVEFVPTTATRPALVNAFVEVLVIGNPATPAVPTFSAVPTITGAAEEGVILTATSGTFAGTPTPLDGYQWVRCNAAGVVIEDISGAVGSTYTITADDIGYTIRVRQVATNSEGTASAISVQTGVVVP
jgi:hypothetical protein